MLKQVVIKTGTEYEEYIVELLQDLSFKAKKTGSNDGGVDIVARATISKDPLIKKYYLIQCKYHNNTVSKAPIQEVFTGTAYYSQKYSIDGTPVVITNNRVTFEARNYAKKLGVEIIADAEWDEIFQAMNGEYRDFEETGIVHEGLLGLILSQILKSNSYLQAVIQEETEDTVPKTIDKIKLELESDFDTAEQHMKEAAYLQAQAAKHSQKAIKLQKRATLKSLEYS